MKTKLLFPVFGLTYAALAIAETPPDYTPEEVATPQPSAVARAMVGDFNGDGHPDLVLYDASTHRTAIWYLNNNVFVGSAYGPTLLSGWRLESVADFNHDGHPDYALVDLGTHRTAIWYLSGPRFIGSAYGPTLPTGWELVAAADFNGDGYPDYVLYAASTRQTMIWYLNNNIFVGSSYGSTILAGGWGIVGVSYGLDPNCCCYFPGYVLFNSLTGQTVFDLGGLIYWGPTVPSGWALVAVADFNGDGNLDYLLYKASTRQTAIWYLNFLNCNSPYVSGSAYGPTLPPGWSLIPQ